MILLIFIGGELLNNCIKLVSMKSGFDYLDCEDADKKNYSFLQRKAKTILKYLGEKQKEYRSLG